VPFEPVPFEPIPLEPVPFEPVPEPFVPVPFVPRVVVLRVPVPGFNPPPVTPGFVLFKVLLLPRVPGLLIPLPPVAPFSVPLPVVPELRFLFWVLSSVQLVEETFPLQFTPGVVVMVPVVLLCASATPGTHKLASDKANIVSLI
jgi:hypothetical protein